MAIETAHRMTIPQTAQGSRGAGVAAHAQVPARVESPAVVQGGREILKTERIALGPDKGSADSAVWQRSPGAGADSLAQLVDMVNERPQIRNRSLQFSVDESTGKMLVKVYDSDTKELIRQFPPEELLELAERLQEILDGSSGSLILQEKA